jgi:hypothetical protein
MRRCNQEKTIHVRNVIANQQCRSFVGKVLSAEHANAIDCVGEEPEHESEQKLRQQPATVRRDEQGDYPVPTVNLPRALSERRHRKGKHGLRRDDQCDRKNRARNENWSAGCTTSVQLKSRNKRHGE